MESKDDAARFAVTKDIASSLYENDVLRDGSAELERARGEFRLGHLQAAATLLDELAFRLKPKLSSADCLEVAATYAASRVLDARIHEEQKLSASLAFWFAPATNSKAQVRARQTT